MVLNKKICIFALLLSVDVMDFKDNTKLFVRFLKETRSLMPLQIYFNKSITPQRQKPIIDGTYNFIDRNLPWTATTEGWKYWWILQMKWSYIYGLWKKMSSQEIPKLEHRYVSDLIYYSEDDSHAQDKYKDILSEVFDLSEGGVYRYDDE